MKGLYWKDTIIITQLLVCIWHVPSGPDRIPSSVGCSMTHLQCHGLQHHGSHEHLPHADSGGAFEEAERSHQESSENVLWCLTKEIQYCIPELSYQCIPSFHSIWDMAEFSKTTQEKKTDYAGLTPPCDPAHTSPCSVYFVLLSVYT